MIESIDATPAPNEWPDMWEKVAKSKNKIQIQHKNKKKTWEKGKDTVIFTTMDLFTDNQEGIFIYLAIYVT